MRKAAEGEFPSRLGCNFVANEGPHLNFSFEPAWTKFATKTGIEN